MSNIFLQKHYSDYNSQFKLRFKSIVCHENESNFHYLSKYLKVRNIPDEQKKEALIKEEE